MVFRKASPGHGFRFKNPLCSLDSTVLDLCLSAFPWATFRQTKGGLKAHMALDHAGHLPAFVTVTDAKTADIEAARPLRLPKGSIVVADRAYMDFKWIDSLILQGVFLVTRLKRRIRYRVVERREADRRRGVTSDQTIEFTSAQGRRQCPRPLRRIDCRDPAPPAAQPVRAAPSRRPARKQRPGPAHPFSANGDQVRVELVGQQWPKMHRWGMMPPAASARWQGTWAKRLLEDWAVVGSLMRT